jgi:hypothetical protein
VNLFDKSDLDDSKLFDIVDNYLNEFHHLNLLMNDNHSDWNWIDIEYSFLLVYLMNIFQLLFEQFCKKKHIQIKKKEAKSSM